MPTFREQVVDAFIDRFGPADATTNDRGIILRWRLPRDHNLDLHIIIDSPEHTYECHTLVSDPCPWVKEKVRTLRIQKWEEVEPSLDSIEAQWRLEGCWAKQQGAPSLS